MEPSGQLTHHSGMDTPSPPSREMELIIQSRRAAESAIGLAMITSLIPGIEVQYLDPVKINLPSIDDSPGT